MIDVICPHCKHVHKEDDSLVNWYWHCQECGELFRWNKFEAAQPSVQRTADSGDQLPADQIVKNYNRAVSKSFRRR